MKRIVTLLAAVTLTASAAQAQFGDILKKLDPNKIKQGAKVAREATREFTEEEEVQLGRVVAARVLATYPLSKNEQQQRYVTLVGNTVAAYSARPTLAWHFAVVDTNIVNAFSCPGGYVFITSGAMAQVHDEAELAALIGHELAHVTQKHILHEIKRANVMNAGVGLAQTTASGSWLNDDMARKVGQIAYDKLFTTGLSRKDELEADKIGTAIAASAGYRAGQFLVLLHDFEQLEGSSQLKQLTATHPSPQERIAALEPTLRNATSGEILAERFTQWNGK